VSFYGWCDDPWDDEFNPREEDLLRELAKAHRKINALTDEIAVLREREKERAAADREYMSWSLGGGMLEAFLAGGTLFYEADINPRETMETMFGGQDR
jgi:hypothetical protein